MNEFTESIGNQECETGKVVRLPLWKSCVEDMLKEGVAHGQTYDAVFFEEKLRCKRTDMKFGLAVSEIRRSLELKGFYLSGRGLKGDSFVILPPENNQDVMRQYAHHALDALKRGVILGTETRLDLLSAEDRRRHESMLEKMAMKLALVKHSSKAGRIVMQQTPKLLLQHEQLDDSLPSDT